MKDFEGEGVFWLEASEDHKVAGIVRFNEADGATLDLIGALSPDMSNLGQETGRSRILGVAGNRVTTLLVSRAGSSLKKSSEGSQDLVGRFGPDEGLGVLVPGLDPGADVFLQGLN